jgi:SWI/SNF-related matrix-associated actin-dependent regulator of chromatin subfamily A3
MPPKECTKRGEAHGSKNCPDDADDYVSSNELEETSDEENQIVESSDGEPSSEEELQSKKRRKIQRTSQKTPQRSSGPVISNKAMVLGAKPTSEIGANPLLSPGPSNASSQLTYPARNPLAGLEASVGNLENAGRYTNQQANEYFEPEAEASQGSEDEAEIDVNREVCLGSITTRIVGIRYYNGIATRGEEVLFVREPNNRFDKNAIRMDNSLHVQVGHIPRDFAAILAPLMDSRKLRLEGKVYGSKSAYDLPIMISVYTSPGDTDLVWQHLKHHILSAEPPQPRVAEVAWIQMLQSLDANSASRQDELMEALGISTTDLAKMSKAPQPTMIKTKMLDFQLQGLQWMLEAENPTVPQDGKIKQFWKKTGHMYQNVASRLVQAKAPELARCGILSDDMGLGKTLQVLALIMTPFPPPKELVETPVAAKTNAKGTLIVAPVSVLGNWTKQIEEHVSEESGLKYHIYHEKGKDISKQELESCDIVITTYCQINQKKNNVIGKIQWRRVVLDEGHIIRNPATKANAACATLLTECSWIISGTPIQNGVKDLHALCKFLHVYPFNDKDLFKRLIERPVKHNDVALLKLLVSTLCLRRHKSMKYNGRPILALPECMSYIHRVTLLPDERKVYDALASEARELLDEMRRDENLVKYNQMLEILTRMRQACNHFALLGKREIVNLGKLLDGTLGDGIDWKDPTIQRLVQTLVNYLEEDCCICLEQLKMPTISRCAHVFCKPCITQVIRGKPSCPLCRGYVHLNQLVTPPPEVLNPPSEDAPPVEKKDKKDLPSSKINALLTFLKVANARDPTTKSIVFSQWSSMLNLIEPHLKQAGLEFARFDGGMSRSNRERSIRKFSQVKECKVFLATLTAGGLGLNLTAANCVYLVDSWWNPSLEAQAVDRIYRLGQTREVSVFRLIADDSVEERVLKVQEKKKALVKEAFGNKAFEEKKVASVRMQDMMFLLGAEDQGQ